MKVQFEKTYLSPLDHIRLLRQRGLVIMDEAKAEEALMNYGYFRLSAYFYPLLEMPKDRHLP